MTDLDSRIKEYLLRQMMQRQSPGMMQSQMQKRAGADELAVAGRLAAGLDEAASVMGGTQASKQLPRQAEVFEAKAEQAKADTVGSLKGGMSSLDPKVLKFLQEKKPKEKMGKQLFGTELKEGPLDEQGQVDITRARTIKDEGFGRRSDIFNKYKDHPVTKKSDLLAVAYQKVRNAADDPSAAGDIALIFGFMKMLDPTSTVREGEFATAANAGSVPQRIWAMYNRLRAGERLEEEQREDFAKQALNAWKAQEKLQKIVDKRFADFASENKVSFTPFNWDIGKTETTKEPEGPAAKTFDEIPAELHEQLYQRVLEGEK